jgi:hypothetical protein
VCVALTSLLVAGQPLEAGREPAPYNRPLSAFDRRVVERVKARAAALLEEPGCRRILAEFKDQGGRTLESNLERLGRSSAEHLQHIAFLDGSRLTACQPSSVTMATTPGVPRVFVCPAPNAVESRLARIERHSGTLAEAMVIHEMLHTLGLGENPPSTFEITDRVRARCR